MKLFEFEGKDLYRAYGVPVPDGTLCRTVSEVADAYGVEGERVVLKSQVLVGGRGKAGGIRFASSKDEVVRLAEELLDARIRGETVTALLLECALDIRAEYYLCVTTDVDQGRPVLMMSAQGGVDIEAVAQQNPDAIERVPIDTRYGLVGYRVLGALQKLGIDKVLHNRLVTVARALYRLYWDLDAELVEINPLVVTADGSVVAADAKVTVDDNALFRHPELPNRPVVTPDDRAAAANMSYVSLDGSIGIISNGAGLTMATMDHLDLEGGRAANFLDGKDSLSKEGFQKGIELILENPCVKAILINIFAGGPRCDAIAEKVVETIDRMESGGALPVPVVATLHGRYSEEGWKILSRCRFEHFHQEAEIEGAIRKAVALAEA